jgi:hypothetical protein
MFEPRENQLDVRLSKIIRFGRARLQANFDVYNLFNIASVLALQTRYRPHLDERAERLGRATVGFVSSVIACPHPGTAASHRRGNRSAVLAGLVISVRSVSPIDLRHARPTDDAPQRRFPLDSEDTTGETRCESNAAALAQVQWSCAVAPRFANTHPPDALGV